MDFSKKILIITNHYPDKSGGGSLASRAIINSFASLFKNCTLIFPYNGKIVGHFFLSCLKTIPCNDRRPRWIKGLEIYFGKLHRFGSCIRKEIKYGRPDLIVFDTSIVSGRIINKAVESGIPVITFHHNAEIDFIRDNPPLFLYRIPFIYFLRRFEKKAVLESKLNLTLTESDRLRLLELYVKDVSPDIKCLGVFESYRAYSEKLPDLSEKYIQDNPRFVISGDLSFPQSDISIRSFIETLWPIVKKRFLNPKLVITGKNPTSELRKLTFKYKEISLVRNPVAILEIVAGCDFYLCPVDKGSGFKFRIMDGLKLGLPVIAHKMSAEGYERFSEEGFISVYDSPDSFNESLSRICFMQIDHKQVKKIYNECFAFETGVKKLERILNNRDL